MNTLLIEDHLLLRDLLRKVCEQEFGDKIVGETGSGAEAIALIKANPFCSLILDIGLDTIDGFEVLRQARDYIDITKTLVITSHCEPFTLVRAERAGVRCLLDKTSTMITSLIEAIGALRRGECFFSQGIKSARIARLGNSGFFTKLISEREEAVLALIGQGLSNEEIGGRLEMHPDTARTHRSNLLKKLKLPNTPKLMAFALENGFVIPAAPPPRPITVS